MADQEPQLSVLDLPDPCLLAILQCLANDHASLFNAARSHSRLHQAVVAALRSISTVVKTQQQLDASLLSYLRKHGQQISGIDLRHDLCHDLFRDLKHAAAAFATAAVSLRQLPPNLQLTSMHFDGLQLQMQACGGQQGVLAAAAALPLKMVWLSRCMLLDACKGLAAELSQLPNLEHLSIDRCVDSNGGDLELWTEGLQRQQQLTHLEFVFMLVRFNRSEAINALQPLNSMTGLVDVRLAACFRKYFTADILSGLSQLIRFEVSSCVLQPEAIAGKTQLQHLEGTVPVDTAGLGELLSQLRPLQQLTALVLWPNRPPVLPDAEGGYRGPPAEAYSALTESSKLGRLSIRHCALPAGVWQQMFSVGKKLPYLRTLDVTQTRQPLGDLLSHLTSFCPGLEGLFIEGLQYNAEQLAPLTRLSSLGRMTLSVNNEFRQVTMDCISQLTGLIALGLEPYGPTDDEGLLLQLTQLRNLTVLKWRTHASYESERLFKCKVSRSAWQDLFCSWRCMFLAIPLT
jgi:hypothetical protein